MVAQWGQSVFIVTKYLFYLFYKQNVYSYQNYLYERLDMSISRSFNLSALENLAQKIERVNQNNYEVLINKLNGFVNANTKFDSFISILFEAGFDLETPEDYAKIARDKIDTFLKKHTRFDSLTALENEALKD
ncbi:hypothetical protein Q4307_11625 [Acinetobacter baumannii]|uniref:hypothetical protein n=1 Tax=Acinetobacter baumannii TaxID=470 RepID=UPI001D0D728C|nr:hypothetical protein [Acinetobacter baumannii]